MLWLVPTRGRPKNADRLINAFKDNRQDERTELMFCIDDDDPKLDQYEDTILAHCENVAWIGYSIGERLRVGRTLNFYATKYVETRKYIGFMGDDHVPRTFGFDALLRRALRDGVEIVYGNDLIQGPNLPTAVMMSSNIIATLGYMNPPSLVHLFLDNFWKLLGEHTNSITYMHDVIIEHVHPISQKVAWDELYVEVNSKEMWDGDQTSWQRYQLEQFNADVMKILELKVAVS